MSTILTPASESPPGESPAIAAATDAVFEAVQRDLAARRLPEATYRLQLHQRFTFRDASGIVPYLAELGISDCYLSPYVKARAGTTHGYDIVDHNALNPEIGGEEDLAAFVSALHANGMGQIVDVVPNHMGVHSGENAWWIDVLENGPGSPYASFFDIDWMPLKPDLSNKVLLPILGDQYGKVLENQQIVLAFDDGAFFVRYYERRFPLAADTWDRVLKHRIEELEQRLGADEPPMLEYRSVLTAIAHLPRRNETDPEKMNERRREKEVIKRRLVELDQASPDVHAFIAENVALFNGTPGDPRSFDLLDQLLLDQSYRLAYWRVAADEINYRRFFDINDMAAICMENPDVFEKTHALILRLLDDERVNGLRIDHPDGLYDPAEYLGRVQKARFLQLCHKELEALRLSTVEGLAADRDFGSSDEAERGEVCTWELLAPRLTERFEALLRNEQEPGLTRPLYVVVEKILEPGERLPEHWPVFGTTGYDFLNVANGLFVDPSQAKTLDALYAKFLRRRINYKELVYRCKRLIMRASMSSEVNVLGYQLDRISERNRRSRDFTLNSLTEALREVIACFPIYRTYVKSDSVLDRDRRYIEQAVSRAKRKNLATNSSVFDFVRDILLLNDPERPDEATKAAERSFVGRFQQVTGPVMAKAVEDTSFYIYNRLTSLNEVGGDPERFGTSVAAFHQQNLQRQAHWPHSLLATSTHDTKRGEDVRTRIDVLSEILREFRARIFRWARMNQGKKTVLEDEPAPCRNDEYLMYQTLLGTWPLEPLAGAAQESYIERIRQYVLKATREAKAKTSWVSPNEAYERATSEFVTALLGPTRRNAFLADFEPFARRVAELGIWNSLSQTLVKFASPGVPDLYQGTELWDDSLVDPDNRRPVDFEHRRELLQSLRERIDSRPESLPELVSELVESRFDGRIKLYLIWRMLRFRRERPGLCTTGRYVPLDATGAQKEHVCAFARKSADSVLLVVAPRLIGGLVGSSGRPPIGEEVWTDTELFIPRPLLARRYRHVFTGDILEGSGSTGDPSTSDRLSLARILAIFPVAAFEPID